MKTGTYIDAQPAVLSDGRPVRRGDTVLVDSRGEDAYLLARLASVEDVKRVVAKRKPRTKQQETES